MKILKWVVVVIVVILAVLWATGKLGLIGISQSAAVIKSTATTPALDQINRDAVAVDTHMQAASADISVANPTQAQIMSALNHYKSAATIMATLRTELASAIVNSNSASSKKTLSEMEQFLSNATSQLEVTRKSISGVSSYMAVDNTPKLQPALTQTKLVQGYMQVARADISIMINALK